MCSWHLLIPSPAHAVARVSFCLAVVAGAEVAEAVAAPDRAPPQRPNQAGLPPGWMMSKRPCSRGSHYIRKYVGPAGETVKTKTQAWEQHMVNTTNPSGKSKQARAIRMLHSMSGVSARYPAESDDGSEYAVDGEEDEGEWWNE